jgi:NADP-dependent 3-hydroxy acid dehydrogenase YdfG
MAGYFEDKVAIVTGGATGIGKALASALLARGAKVVITGRRANRLDEAEQALGGGDRLVTAVNDVTDFDALKRVVDETIERWGAVDLMINNAGAGMAGEVKDSTLEDWDRMWSVNVKGVVNGVHAVYSHMIARGAGHIVNISSGAGLVPQGGMAHYVAAKHAVTGLSMSLRMEARQYGVKVTVACPGAIESEILETSTFRGLDGEKLREKAPKIFMSADECARQILRGVAKNRGIVPVTKITKVNWALYRVSPSISARLNRVRFEMMKKLGAEG